MARIATPPAEPNGHRPKKGVSLNVRIPAVAKERIRYAAECSSENEELTVGMNRVVTQLAMSLKRAPGEPRPKPKR